MMKVKAYTVFDILSRLRTYFQGSHATPSEGQEPFRSELYTSDQMDAHGKVVARSHKLLKNPTSDKLLKRLDDNEKELLEARNLLVESIRSGKTVTPAAEWLLDNFYLIEEQIVIARKHLPKGYSEDLPCLASGISAGMPRVYDIVLEIISHSDGRVDVKGLSSYIESYQSLTELMLGELWAIPIMLRLAVIENLRRLSGSIALDMIDHNLADYWAERLVITIKENPTDLILTVADMARTKPVLNSSFVAGFTRELQGKGPALTMPLNWMEQQLTVLGVSTNDLVRQENQKQAADQVSVRNSIGTLRFLGATDWREFVETLSSVEQVLRQDPTGTYPHMNFSTRDQYRHVVESISKMSSLSETMVAKLALDLASRCTVDNELTNTQKHIGYYLIDKGRKQTEKASGTRYSLTQNWIRLASRMPVFIYLFSIALLTLAGATSMFYLVWRYGTHDWLLLSLVGILSLSGAAQFAVSLVNWLSSIWVTPVLLPRMDFSKDIPPEYRTLVIVPTMLSSRAYIEELVEGLEVRYLANAEDNLHFGLLTDFSDADSERMPEDEALLKQVSNRIQELNLKYKRQDQEIFYLFHRPRTWNESEHKWMGYERKRGKLSALNALLRNRSQNEFSLIIGNDKLLSNIKYVITLDSDTQLPRESAWKFIATMAHPLNRPIFNNEKKRVTHGYGILQPRIATGIPTKTSLYSHMQGDVSGVDPYTRVSSDVYQDLFGEGSYIGKGIYDVDIFEQALHQVFPENRILSHDLIEGCYTRSGLISDVLLYDENPSQYEAEVKRHHRWIRGDWQIASWIFPFIRLGNGKSSTNKLSALSRWKIFDNLRRSLLPLSLLLLLVAGWTVLPFPWFWTLTVTIIVLFAVMAAAGWQLLNKPKDLTFKAHAAEVGSSVRDVLLRFMFGLAVMPYEALRYTDGVVRTNWRMLITRKKLLEWSPSATASATIRNEVWSVYAKMWIAPTLALACTAAMIYLNPGALLVAFPILIFWFISPALAWRVSMPRVEKELMLPEEQHVFLHKAARKTWSFFEEFVNEGENWLPPDNFQEKPVAAIAHRTSPTNMGLALLANLAAYDFGYITGGELTHRCNNTLQTMDKLTRYHGHFFNWYDTLTLSPLSPRYVSTVDSGNLIGHLLTLRQGLLEVPDQPIISKNLFEGLTATALIIQDQLKEKDSPIIEKMVTFLQKARQENHDSVWSVKKNLDELIVWVDELANVPESEEASKYIGRFSQQVKNRQDDLAQLAPWLVLMPVPVSFTNLAVLDNIPSLKSIQRMATKSMSFINQYEQESKDTEEKNWLISLRTLLSNASSEAEERILLLDQVADQCEQFTVVEYNFLFDKSTSLLRIGYNVDEQRKDNSFYDLLASEARLGIFVGIAQGKLPQESWFALGRLLTNSGGDPILLSWSGSMFEYLMPQLIMPVYENTLLYQTGKATVRRQIEYAEQRGIPWGISESGYNTVDANFIYQYRAFGVPGLGLKRGLDEDLVIAPYATMMALMVSPAKACTNLQVLAEAGFEGEHGFFEAIDYTKGRLPRGKSFSIVQSYMAHHQGMALLSMAYVLLNKPMQQRFVSELRFQATLLLLQERIPKATLFYAHTADLMETHATVANAPVRVIYTSNTVTPEIQLLSNGRYQVMVTNSGGGYSRWKDIAVTRWREDTTQDDRGIFCYIKDVETGKFWSNTHQPTLQSSKNYETIFSQGHVEFRRVDHGIETKTEIVISPEDDTEMRRIKLTNRTTAVRILEITSYAEVVMASQASDESHPAFSNLFVQTEIVQEHNAVFCTRRPRSKEETPPFMFHMMQVHGVTVEAVSYETDRMQFIGRGNTLVHPQAMNNEILSGSQGSVLDPILSIRYRITIKPNRTATIDLIYGISETHEACEGLMHKYRDQHLKKRAFELSWTHNQVLLRQINATEADSQLFDQMAASVIYANPRMRADESVIRVNLRGQSGLWSHSVSGDLPIVLVHIYDPDNLELVKQLIKAHAYWRLKGLGVDLVIWNEDYGSYRQLLQQQILGLISSEAVGHPSYTKPGNIFVKSADQLSTEDRVLFESVARVILHDGKGTLSEQINREYLRKALPPMLEVKPMALMPTTSTPRLPEDLLYFNGTGGFTSDGTEYKILTNKNKTTPAPWVNVIANPLFGTVISENGSAYTWSINAHEYRLTPWSNDPVSDAGGEAFYLRDEESGRFWSPSPFPSMGKSSYITTHGFGYTNFESAEEGIATNMFVFVDIALPIKFIVLKIKNNSGRERKLSATGFMEMILGDVRSKTNMHIISDHDVDSGALLFRNRYNSAFADRVTFFKVDASKPTFTTDRSEFIGRNRKLNDPQSLYRKKLSGRCGAGIDPCAALQVKFDLLDGAEREIIFQLGNEVNTEAAKALIYKFTGKGTVEESLQQVKEYWKKTLDAVQITTPDRSLDILTNGWLMYQTISCRIFARSGFYQSGGAFGFRDQLQDVLALVHSQPNIVRDQILLSASRQFVEGDVQHWWHPPEGRGVRTKCSDDMLWLPYVVSRYVVTTGDQSILAVDVGFLESRPLLDDEESLYDLPLNSHERNTLYEHCVRAIKHSLRFGEHGLPLIGSGDWNDGMDQVGNKGRGESVWLAFFLYDVLTRFTEMAEISKDSIFSETCKKEALALKANIEVSGWDGEWYKRAYFDDGTPLGSKVNEECRIDAIAQSWSVLSGAGTPQRREMAMASLDKYLVRRDLKLIQLLDPPFDVGGINPGYIKGYVPGVRENGGQYSHAAIWTLMAFAALGDREKVWELFSMIQPINHASDANGVATYKVEPYVMAADVYANESHQGRGGWTWYTGSSGWMYQFILSSLMGMKLNADHLVFKPCFPQSWPSISIQYQFGNATYNIMVFQITTESSWWKMDNMEGKGDSIKLTDDGLSHEVEIYIKSTVA